MDLTADLDKTNNTTTKQNMLTKEEITNYLISNDWSEDKLFLPLAFKDKDFSNLNGDMYKVIAEKYRNWDYKKPLVSAILSNQNGIGKTHLAIGALKSYYEEFYKKNEDKNYEIYLKKEETDLYYSNFVKCNKRFKDNYYCRFFMTERTLLNEIKNCLKYDSETTEEDVLKKYSLYYLLVIDDVFSSRESNYEFSRSKILAILDMRMYYTMNPTIITSNLTLEEIAKIDTRIASRINNSMLIEIKSKQIDYRSLE